jgi:hypothetical protein
MDSGRVSAFELRGGFPTCWEALQPLEPHHSPENATPSYYTKNESFASGISKMLCVSSHFHHRGLFIGTWLSSTDLEKLVRCQVVVGRPVGWSHLHQHSSLPWPATPRVDTCHQNHGPNRHKTWPAGQGVWLATWPLGPFGLGFGPLSPCIKYTPVV